jgi:uncharacterized protein (DUF1697 family)
MPKYVAFLRAINVGGHTVKMDHLRGLFEALKFSNVETFIASGNVIFDSPSRNTKALEKKIEEHLHQALGYRVATFIRTPPELTAVSQYKPFADSDLNVDGNTLYIGFITAAPGDEAREKLLACATKIDGFHVYGREVYWLYRRTLGESTFPGAQLERVLGMQTTLRNANTVRRIVAKYSRD